MCTGAETALVMAATSAAGTAISMSAADDAANKKQNLINQGEEENQRISQAGENRVNDFAATTFDGKARDARYEDAAANRETSLVSALTDAATTPETAAGNVSSDYLNAQSTSQADGMTQAQKQAKLLARSGASGLMYGSESMMGGQLASDLAGVAQKARRNGQYTQNAVNEVGNGGSLVGGLMQGAGAAGMSYAGSKQ